MIDMDIVIEINMDIVIEIDMDIVIEIDMDIVIGRNWKRQLEERYEGREERRRD